MKISRWFFGLFTLLALFACEKQCEEYTHVAINFLDESHTVTFTGEQGQGTYTITPATPAMNLPATGTYAVCLNFTGGCPAAVISASTDTKIVGYAGAPGTYCATGHTLEGQYIVNSQCE